MVIGGVFLLVSWDNESLNSGSIKWSFSVFWDGLALISIWQKKSFNLDCVILGDHSSQWAFEQNFLLSFFQGRVRSLIPLLKWMPEVFGSQCRELFLSLRYSPWSSFSITVEGRNLRPGVWKQQNCLYMILCRKKKLVSLPSPLPI